MKPKKSHYKSQLPKTDLTVMSLNQKKKIKKITSWKRKTTTPKEKTNRKSQIKE